MIFFTDKEYSNLDYNRFAFHNLEIVTYLRMMYLYNVSVIIEESEHHAVRLLLDQLLDNLLKQAVAVQLLELLDSPHEGVTYSIQFKLTDSAEVAHIQTQYLSEIQSKTTKHHGGKVFYFDSLMRYIEAS